MSNAFKDVACVKQCRKHSILNLNPIGPYFDDSKYVYPHSTQYESKVVAGSHVSDVPDWCIGSYCPMLLSGILHWRNVPQRSHV